MAARNDLDLVPSSGEPSPELVPVVDAGSLQFMAPQAPATSGSLSLDGLLAEALFGEIIDISDLIPRVLSSQAAGSVAFPVDLFSAADTPMTGGTDMLMLTDHTGALAILYDDDILASDGGTL